MIFLAAPCAWGAGGGGLRGAYNYDIPSSSLCMGSWGGGLRGAYIMCPVHGELGKRLTNSSYL